MQADIMASPALYIFPAAQDRARIVFDCRMANEAAMISSTNGILVNYFWRDPRRNPRNKRVDFLKDI
jgi:hypothetical protein